MFNRSLSIIVTCYNDEKYILECIDSILNNGYSPIELIVVNDGSTDNTAKLLNDYITNNKLIYIYKDNGGVSSARLSGIKVATGDYITFVDGDDAVGKGSYQSIMELFKVKDCDIVNYPILYNWRGANETLSNCKNIKVDSKRYICDALLKSKFSFSVCNKVFDRKLMSLSEFPLGQYYEDMFFWTKLLESEIKVYNLQENALYLYRYNANSVTKSFHSPNKIKDYILACYSVNKIARRNKAKYSNRIYFYSSMLRLLEEWHFELLSVQQKRDIYNLLNTMKPNSLMAFLLFLIGKIGSRRWKLINLYNRNSR